MASKTVTIKYVGVPADIVRSGLDIFNSWTPSGGYADSDPYVNGGYTLLTAQPADWATNYTSYFTKSGDAYVPVTGGSAPTFGEGTYYAANGKSVYATHVGKFGEIDSADFLKGLLPMATSPQLIAQFERAIISAKNAAEAGTTDNGISFSIGEDYKEELYWSQISNGVKVQGFTVTIA